jgi:2-hydroxychromene-2-carboxylate isomerase
MSETLTAYFSLRSPYSWLALHRLDRLGARLGASLQLVPIYPRGDVSFNDPAANHARMRYLIEDVGRTAAAYGLALRPPPSVDTRWELSHAACTYAEDEGLALPFALAAANARFARGQDLGALDVLEEIAGIVGLDPARVIEAAQDPVRHARVDAGITAARQAGVIGVPFFVYAGKRFWGNDRLEWVLREIDRTRGLAVPELRGAACFAPPWVPTGS